MKRIEKLARDAVAGEPFYAYQAPAAIGAAYKFGFEAGFRTAREMAAELCDDPPRECRNKYEEGLEPSFTALQRAIEDLGEEAV